MRSPRLSRVEIANRAASLAVICERQRVADLEALRAGAEQERAAHAERIARLLDCAGFAEAAMYVRTHGHRRLADA